MSEQKNTVRAALQQLEAPLGRLTQVSLSTAPILVQFVGALTSMLTGPYAVYCFSPNAGIWL